ncbi:MAG: hypothetical protein OXR84_07075 [Magnetovibrio sp.]|nr:hypothetical protein [Magnetovibrio sp.]
MLRFDELLNSVGPKRAERLENAIEGIARKYIGSGDVLRAMGNGVFITIFGGISKAEAEAKCALIRDDVNQFAAGDPNLKGELQVSTVVAAVDGTMKVSDLDDFEAVFARLEESQEAPRAAAQEAAPEAAPTAAPAEAGTVSAAAYDDWDQWLNVDAAGAGEPVQPVTAPGGAAATDGPRWRDIPYEGLGAAAPANTETFDPATLRSQFEAAEVVPRPVWDVERKVMAAVASVPVRRLPKTIVGDAMVGANPMGVVTLSLDRLAVKWACDELAAETEDGPERVVIPVHFMSLASMRNRALLFTACLDLPAEARPRVMGEVSFPDGIHLTAVEDVVRLFQPFVGRIGVSCGIGWRMFSNLKSWGVEWVGFSADPDMDEDEATDKMANFAIGASQAGLVPYAKDLPSRNLVMAAGAVGIRHVFARPDPHAGASYADAQFKLDDLHGTP